MSTLWAIGSGEIVQYKSPPGCATCRRHECKNPECRWTGYRRPQRDDHKLCPRCESECHVLMTRHGFGVCRLIRPLKRTNTENMKGRKPRNVVPGKEA